MSYSTPEALRAALPAHLHHLAEPLSQILEALADSRTNTAVSEALFRGALADPDTNTAMTHALDALRGQSVSLPSGVHFSFNDSTIGDITMHDVAGRDINHYTFNITPPNEPPSPLVPIPVPGLPPGQARVLRILVLWPKSYLSISPDLIASLAAMSVSEVKDALRELRQQNLARQNLTLSGLRLEPTDKGRSLLNTADAYAAAMSSPSRQLDLYHQQILVGLYLGLLGLNWRNEIPLLKPKPDLQAPTEVERIWSNAKRPGRPLSNLPKERSIESLPSDKLREIVDMPQDTYIRKLDDLERHDFISLKKDEGPVRVGFTYEGLELSKRLYSGLR